MEEAARNLLRLRNKLDIRRVGEPAKLVVLTGGGYAYERADGVAVVPLTVLGP